MLPETTINPTGTPLQLLQGRQFGTWRWDDDAWMHPGVFGLTFWGTKMLDGNDSHPQTVTTLKTEKPSIDTFLGSPACAETTTAKQPAICNEMGTWLNDLSGEFYLPLVGKWLKKLGITKNGPIGDNYVNKH